MAVTIKRGRIASLIGDRDDEEDEEYGQMPIDPYVQFDMTEPGHCVLLCGRGKSGKTTLIRWLYRVNKAQGAFDYVVVMCNSPQIDSAYGFVPKKLRRPYSDDMVRRLLEIQKAYIDRGEPKKLLLILDDIVGAADFHNGSSKKLIQQLCTSGRHYNILTCILVQHYFAVPPAVRRNAWYTMMCNPSSRDVKEFYEQYHTHDTLQECQSFMKECATDHTFAYVCTDDDQARLVRVPEEYVK